MAVARLPPGVPGGLLAYYTVGVGLLDTDGPLQALQIMGWDLALPPACSMRH